MTFSVEANLKRPAPRTMCIQIIERFSVCRCIYYRHAVDPCPARAQRHHGLADPVLRVWHPGTFTDSDPHSVQEKTVFVGYACERHARTRGSLRHLHHGPIGSLWKRECEHFSTGVGSRQQRASVLAKAHRLSTTEESLTCGSTMLPPDFVFMPSGSPNLQRRTRRHCSHFF